MNRVFECCIFFTGINRMSKTGSIRRNVLGWSPEPKAIIALGDVPTIGSVTTAVELVKNGSKGASAKKAILTMIFKKVFEYIFSETNNGRTAVVKEKQAEFVLMVDKIVNGIPGIHPDMEIMIGEKGDTKHYPPAIFYLPTLEILVNAGANVNVLYVFLTYYANVLNTLISTIMTDDDEEGILRKIDLVITKRINVQLASRDQAYNDAPLNQLMDIISKSSDNVERIRKKKSLIKKIIIKLLNAGVNPSTYYVHTTYRVASLNQHSGGIFTELGIPDLLTSTRAERDEIEVDINALARASPAERAAAEERDIARAAVQIAATELYSKSHPYEAILNKENNLTPAAVKKLIAEMREKTTEKYPLQINVPDKTENSITLENIKEGDEIVLYVYFDVKEGKYTWFPSYFLNTKESWKELINRNLLHPLTRKPIDTNFVIKGIAKIKTAGGKQTYKKRQSRRRIRRNKRTIRHKRHL